MVSGFPKVVECFNRRLVYGSDLEVRTLTVSIILLSSRPIPDEVKEPFRGRSIKRITTSRAYDQRLYERERIRPIAICVLGVYKPELAYGSTPCYSRGLAAQTAPGRSLRKLTLWVARRLKSVTLTFYCLPRPVSDECLVCRHLVGM